MNKSKRLALGHLIGLIIIHIGSLYAILNLNWNIETIAVLFITYQIKSLGITIGFHRLFTHRAFKANSFIQFMLALMGTLAGQGPLARWVHHHRDHHRYSDKEQDPHSPVQGNFYTAHLGWLLQPESFDDEKFKTSPLKLSATTQFLSDNFNIIFLLQIPLLYLMGGKDYLLSGFFLSTLLSLHSTFLVNSLCHMIGSRPNKTNDQSRNNLFVALVTNGEGWHNNHHFRQNLARHGWEPYQLDISYQIIRVLEKLNGVWDVKR